MKFRDTTNGHILKLLHLEGWNAVFEDTSAKYYTTIRCAADSQFLEYVA